ncbi:protein transport protein Yos1p [Trichomonascus vanleenenianus]|uniref:Yos1p n=1 Tax=Trichomonascus vanleenenianus TaxID=2268995 RepID=UPI003EC9B933
MFLGLILYVTVLLLNAVAILSEERFLARLGWGSNDGFGSAPGEESVKMRLLSLIQAIRTVMRPFLIAFNISIIVYEFIRF